MLEAASGLLLVALGAIVLWVRPRGPTQLAFGTFSIFWGSDIVLINIALLELEYTEALLYAATVTSTAAAASLVWLTTRFPRPATRSDRFAFVTAGAVGVGFALIGTGSTITYQIANPGALPELEPVLYSTGFMAFLLAHPFFMGSLLYAILLWTLRYLTAPEPDGRTRRQYALATAALVSWVGFIAGYGPDDKVSPRLGFRTGDPFVLALTVPPLLVLCAVAVIWLYAQHRVGDARIGRNMAWFVLAVPVLGLLYSFMEPWGAFALTRVLATALLAIGILRFRMLSLDFKIRWTVSRS